MADMGVSGLFQYHALLTGRAVSLQNLSIATCRFRLRSLETPKIALGVVTEYCYTFKALAHFRRPELECTFAETAGLPT